jgi:hypothetical protein
MRACAWFLGAAIAVGAAHAQDAVDQARQLEARGEAAKAGLRLREAASGSDASASVLQAYAEFLDTHGSADARGAYEKVLANLPPTTPSGARVAAIRRLVVLNLAEGDQAAAANYLRQYLELGGAGWEQSAIGRAPEAGPTFEKVTIPGPLSSFERMAAVSQDTQPDELLEDLARSLVIHGFQAGSGQEGLQPTEFLKLLTRYLSQARELERLAGSDLKIKVESCDSTQTADILRVLGYRMRGGCGKEVVLETVNATRAFLTVDSGFPLSDLEQALRTNRPFTYDYRPSEVPVRWTADYWVASKQKQEGGFIEAFIADPSLCRFYLAMSKPDADTAEQLRKAIPAQRLKAFAHVLDFYGSMLQIRDGKVDVPGGTRSARMWEELVGVSPDKGTAFVERLISRDDGWLASYFDALSRISGPVKDYLTAPERLQRFYAAIRGRVTSPGPARPVFRANTDMLLLTTRLRLDPGGQPHIPGGIGIWRDVFLKISPGKYGVKFTRAAKDWKEPDDVIEAIFALCRRSMENEPLRVFLALSDFNRGREHALLPATAERMVREYSRMSAQYAILSEAPTVGDTTILRFLDYAALTNRMRDQALRSDAAGMFQATVGLWQILCRQGAIPAPEAEPALAAILSAFERARAAGDLFEAGRSGVGALLKAAGIAERTAPQDRLLDLLAGGASQSGSELQTQAVNEMQSYMEAQRLVPLNVLFQVADHADNLAKGEKLNPALIGRVTSRLSEIGASRAALTGPERTQLVFGYWSDRHIEQQKRLNLRSIFEKAGVDPEKLRDVKSSLSPLLRDTLVGLNYVYYAPPGAQLLRANPIFVRSHDFIGTQSGNVTWNAADLYGSGWPTGAGGRLIGSLAGLPYALADTEQNFLVPTREQALIWGDLAPQVLISAKVPRWWNVSYSQMHWLALHVRYGTALLAEAALDGSLRQQVLEVLREQASPARVRMIRGQLERGEAAAAIEDTTPSELLVLAKEMLVRHPESRDLLSTNIRRMSAEDPARINYASISTAFGTPKPTLASSYRPELLYVRTFPSMMGYSSRILAESWESNTIYFATLADELLLPPAQLNFMIPQWTEATLQQIFATHLEDWPAVLRSLRHVGEDVRVKARAEDKAAGGLARVLEGERP